jgi:hypothetical protein
MPNPAAAVRTCIGTDRIADRPPYAASKVGRSARQLGILAAATAPLAAFSTRGEGGAPMSFLHANRRRTFPTPTAQQSDARRSGLPVWRPRELRRSCIQSVSVVTDRLPEQRNPDGRARLTLIRTFAGGGR